MNSSEQAMVAALKSGSMKALEPVPAEKRGAKLVTVHAVQVLTLCEIIERLSAAQPPA